MEIQFLGATKTVTGSKYLLKAEKKILIDGTAEIRSQMRPPQIFNKLVLIIAVEMVKVLL